MTAASPLSLRCHLSINPLCLPLYFVGQGSSTKGRLEQLSYCRTNYFLVQSFCFPPEFSGLCGSAKDLIRQLLHTDPRKRLTAEQALRHRWCIKEQAAPNDLTMTRNNLRRIGRHKFKARSV
jgi:hypothetical protein